MDLMRRLGLEHLAALLELDQLGYGGHWGEQSYRTELERPNSTVLGAFDPDERLVGFGILWRIEEEAHIISLVVHPQHRRLGVGTALLQALLAEARATGCAWATLEVRESNQAARRLYKQAGFVELGRRKRYYAQEDALILWKKPL